MADGHNKFEPKRGSAYIAPMHFSHELSDDNTAVTQLFSAQSLPHCRVQFTIRIESPKSKALATFNLPRYRVAALIEQLQEWHAATKGERE